jgi:hypothetical protein
MVRGKGNECWDFSAITRSKHASEAASCWLTTQLKPWWGVAKLRGWEQTDSHFVKRAGWRRTLSFVATVLININYLWLSILTSPSLSSLFLLWAYLLLGLTDVTLLLYDTLGRDSADLCHNHVCPLAWLYTGVQNERWRVSFISTVTKVYHFPMLRPAKRCTRFALLKLRANCKIEEIFGYGYYVVIGKDMCGLPVSLKWKLEASGGLWELIGRWTGNND